MEVQEYFYSDDPSRGLIRMEVDTPLRGGRLEMAVRKARRGEEPGYGVGLEIPEKLERISVRGILP